MQLHAVFALGLDEAEWSASRPGRTVPGKGLFSSLNRRLCGPRACVEPLEKEKLLSAISPIMMLRSSSP